MPEGGFRAAQAYVEVTARLDEDKVLAAARRAAAGMESTLQEGGERAGRGLTGALERAGSDAGEAVVRSTEGRLRDGKGRFLKAGAELGEGVRKGAEDDNNRNGFRAFLGLIKAAPKAGFDAAGGLVGALSQGLKGPAGPYLIAGLSAGAVIAGPLVGGILAAGIMTGIAGAGIGGGVILAAKDPAVKHAWAQTGDSIGEILTDAASPFKAELIGAADQATSAFQRWEPMFHQIFGVASTMLDPFVDALEDSGDRLLPSIMTMINNAGPAVDALADGISGTVDAVADVIDMLDDNGPEAAAALKVAFFLLESSIRNVGWVVNGLTEAFGAVIELALDMGGLFVNIGAAAQTMPGPIGDMGDKMVGLGLLLEDGGRKWHELKGRIQGATDAGSDGTAKLDERTKFLSLSMGEAVTQAGSLSAAFKLLNGGALNAREAESAYQAAVDGVTASIKEHGKGLNKQKTDFDLSTDAGRANDKAMRTLVGTIDQKAQAAYDEANATKGSAAAEAAAKGVYEDGRKQLIKNLTQILGNAGAAKALADKIMGIPKSWGTTTSVETAAAEAKVRTIKKAIETIKGKTVYVTVVERKQSNGDVHLSGKGGSGTQVAGAATGGPIMGGSGYRDDVPLMAMGGEWVLQKPAVKALERQFGKDYLGRLNTWHLGGRGGHMPPVHPGWGGSGGGHGGPRPVIREATASGADGLARPAMGPTLAGPARESHVISIGTVTLDASGMKSIQDVVDLIGGLQITARSYRARTATVAGR